MRVFVNRQEIQIFDSCIEQLVEIFKRDGSTDDDQKLGHYKATLYIKNHLHLIGPFESMAAIRKAIEQIRQQYGPNVKSDLDIEYHEPMRDICEIA